MFPVWPKGSRDYCLIYVSRQNEDEVGAAIAEKVAAKVIERKDIFVTTKCWSAFHSKAKARECLLTSLKSLKLDYVDLYLIHWPMGFKVY